jgi:hypothetical protein
LPWPLRREVLPLSRWRKASKGKKGARKCED